MVDIVNVQDNQNVFDGNVKVNSFADELIDKNIQIHGYQTEKYIYDIVNMNKQINNSKINIFNNNILIEDTKLSLYDVIFFDFPSGYHNINHASCCNKIKKLKLRGTKAEPLLLQLIFSSLTKNGKAMLIVPDSLLFSDSSQSIETRKYLIQFFNIKKIVQIDDVFYTLKGQKNSILYFENNGKTTNIEYSKITLDNDKVVEEHIINLSEQMLNKNYYSLYYKYYLDKPIENLEHKFAYDLFNFNSETVGKIISLSKNYKNDSSINIVDSVTNPNNINISCKEYNMYLILYLEYILRTKYDQLTKGKMLQFDIEKIKKISIPLLSSDKQKAVINYLEITNKIINSNIEKITMYTELKNCFLKTIPEDNLIEISEICTIYENNQTSSNNLLGIIKNGQNAGTVYMADALSNNSYYLHSDTFLTKYIYYYLKANENKLFELANRTMQANMTKTIILSLKIPNIDINNQKEIITMCDNFDNNIEKYQFDNNNIRDKDIFATILKLNNLLYDRKTQTLRIHSENK
jgi:hypothetical protein